MQGGAPPRVVPRVVLELAPQELMRLLGDPAPLARLLRGLCDEHAFDGLVAPSNAPACTSHMPPRQPKFHTDRARGTVHGSSQTVSLTILAWCLLSDVGCTGQAWHPSPG